MANRQNRRKELRLLKRGRQGIFHAIFSRFGLVLILLLLQFLILFEVFLWFGNFLPHFYGGSVLFSAVIVLFLLNGREDPSVKITWLIVIMLMPVFGVLLYCFTKSDLGHRAMKGRLHRIISETKDAIVQSEETAARFEAENKGAAALSRYVRRSGCFPVYDRTSVTYFPLGEDKFAEMLCQLKKAEHFILMEYFIIEEGHMWGEILEILAEKVQAGVDVRLMYDGMCEFALLPRSYPKQLQALGIKCKIFAPVAPLVSTHYNYRDHRKILVIDGHTAFTGGINLADEYINKNQRFGHWKDTAVMLKGEAVRSFTLAFLQVWSIDEREFSFDEFLCCPADPQPDAKGFVLPYSDCPLDGDKVGERVYMDILNRAERYVHIMTPYLILDGEMETALKFAAERGVDVTLILPGIPDKKIPYALAKTHYRSLLESGVHIYEYTPGFVHAKVFVSDDREAVVGTINLDYRSFYHHFECAAYLYESDCIPAIEADVRETLAKCRRVTFETVRKEKAIVKIVGFFAKVVAPLL